MKRQNRAAWWNEMAEGGQPMGRSRGGAGWVVA